MPLSDDRQPPSSVYAINTTLLSAVEHGLRIPPGVVPVEHFDVGMPTNYHRLDGQRHLHSACRHAVQVQGARLHTEPPAGLQAGNVAA